MIARLLPISIGSRSRSVDPLDLLADPRGPTSIAELHAIGDGLIRETQAILAAHPRRSARSRARRQATARRSTAAAPSASRRRAEPTRRQRPTPRAHAPSRYLTAPSTPSWKL
jgi:hypothetical protein